MKRRDFIKVGISAVAGAAVASAVEIPFFQSQISQDSGQITQLNNQVSSLQQQLQNLQSELGTTQGFLTLNSDEQVLVEAAAEAIIPSDSNGPGAKEAGVIYFIDRQLAGDYGKSGNMYMQGPFIQSGLSGPVTVDGITYPAGTPSVRVGAGTRYQYGLNMREFWRVGLQALQAYSNSAYGSNFENLSSDKQAQVLSDIWNNKPANFNGILPQDFAYELFFMVWSGFTMDPLYGGNRNMVGWQYLAFNGTNTGNFYREGLDVKQLMVASQPTRLKPASLAQLQQTLGEAKT